MTYKESFTYRFTLDTSGTSTLDPPEGDVILSAQTYPVQDVSPPDPRMPPMHYYGLRRDLPLSKQLIAAIPMWERTGTILRDYVTGQYPVIGGSNLIDWVPTQMGVNAQFQGNASWSYGYGYNGYSTVALKDFTASIWIAAQLSPPPLGEAFFIKDQNSTYGIYCEFITGTSGVLECYGTYADFALNQNDWTHLVIGRQNGQVFAYQDGAGLSVSNNPSTNTLTINYLYLANNGFNQFAANFLLWQRALTNGEILDLFNRPWRLYEKHVPVAQYYDYLNIDVQPAGVWANGTALVSSDQNYRVTPAGVLVGGTAHVTSNQGAGTTGGVRANGDTVVQADYNPTTTGKGAIVLGGGVYFEDMGDYLPRGGAFCNGTAHVGWITHYTPSGGAIVGTPPEFAGGYTEKTTLTVPAGKVIADVPDEVFKLWVTLDPTPVENRFELVDSLGATLPIEIDINESGDYLVLTTKATLLHGTDNVFTFYWA